MAGRNGIYSATLTGDWGKLKFALANAAARFPQAMEAALMEEAAFYRDRLREGIVEQTFGGTTPVPLSPLTLALRRLRGNNDTKILYDTHAMANAIRAVPAGRGAAFVGILDSAKGRDGRPLAVVGRVHEYGAVIRRVFTRKQMAAMAVAMKQAGISHGYRASLGVIRIPARPWFAPVMAEYGGKRGADRFMARVAQKMGGLLGVLNHPDLGGKSPVVIPQRLAGFSIARGSQYTALRAAQNLSGKLRGKFAFQRHMSKRVFARSLSRGLGVRFKAPVIPKAHVRRMAGTRKPTNGASARNRRPPGAARGAGSPRRSRAQKSAHVRAFRKHQKAQLKAQSGRQQNAHVRAFIKHNKQGPKKQRVRASRAQRNAHVKAFKKVSAQRAKTMRRDSRAAAKAKKEFMRNRSQPKINLAPKLSKKPSRSSNKMSVLPKGALKRPNPKSAPSNFWWSKFHAPAAKQFSKTKKAESRALKNVHLDIAKAVRPSARVAKDAHIRAYKKNVPASERKAARQEVKAKKKRSR